MNNLMRDKYRVTPLRFRLQDSCVIAPERSSLAVKFMQNRVYGPTAMAILRIDQRKANRA